MTLIILTLLVACILALIVGLRSAEKEAGTLVSVGNTSQQLYRKRQSVMNKSEQALFLELKRQLPPTYHIFPNMRIADIIDAVNGKGFYYRRNKILPKHVDFIICNKSFEPLLAVELNGGSHKRPERIERDELVQRIFKDAKLPLEFIHVGSSFVQTVAEVRSLLSELEAPTKA